MKILVFTGNARRHRFVANTLAAEATDTLIVSEEGISGPALESDPLIVEHFKLRSKTEGDFFKDDDEFRAPALSVPYKDASHPKVVDTIREFKPGAAFVFGASILREPLFSLIPPKRFINLHLGLSPYYRGAGTNFWPFVNNELEFVGATIHHLDPGIDTGDILLHARPDFENDDTVHTAGCKTIERGALALARIAKEFERGIDFSGTPQWSVPNERLYRTKDFNREALEQYLHNLQSGMVKRYCQNPKTPDRLIPPPWR